MATIQLKDLDCQETVLVPQMEPDLRQAVTTAANPSQRRILVAKVEESLASIRHKLTVVMYQTALVCELKPDDFANFVEAEKLSILPPQATVATYKGCSFTINEVSEYRLFLTLFIETFAATSFSLFDVCGHLLNDLYDLQIAPDKTSFYDVYQKLKKRNYSKDSQISRLLSQYDLNDSHCVDWFKPLKEIRNRTTHRPITGICDFSRRGPIYATVSDSHEFLLNREIYPSGSPDVRLCDFAQQVFDGLQDFVETFYEELIAIVQDTGSLPI